MVGNEEATYLLTKKKWAEHVQSKSKIKYRKQMWTSDGKVTVPHEDFLKLINAIRYVFRIRS
jgi:isocitrate lyase